MADITSFLNEHQRFTNHPLRLWYQLAAVLIIAVEVGWLLPWFAFVFELESQSAKVISTLILGGVMVTTYLVFQFTAYFRLLKSVQLISTGIILSLGVILGYRFLLERPFSLFVEQFFNLEPDAILFILFITWVWWRGLSLAGVIIRPIFALRRFVFGVLLLMVYIFISYHQSAPSFRLSWQVFFLFIGLFSVIVARVSFISQSKSSSKHPFQFSWLADMLVALGFAVLLAALLGSLLTGRFSILLEYLDEAFRALVAIFLFILAIPSLILSVFLGPLVPWLRSLVGPPTSEEEVDFILQVPSSLEISSSHELSIGLIIQTLCFWGIIAILVILIIYRVKKFLLAKRLAVVPQPESLLERGDVSRLIKQALQEAVGRFSSRLRPIQRSLAVARIRRVYGQLIDLCSEFNLPRSLSHTPLEFLPEMCIIFPALTVELEVITKAYNKVRYGEYPDSKADLGSVEAAWRRIKEEGRRMRKGGYGKLRNVDKKDKQRPEI